jgi:hypothetical protein
MIRRGKASNTIGQFALDFARQESVCGEHGRRACSACSSRPASADGPPRGLALRVVAYLNGEASRRRRRLLLRQRRLLLRWGRLLSTRGQSR